jgi:DNA-binding NtrC family response regulator
MGATMRILFVDDEQNILNALERSMRGEPWELAFESGAIEALRRLETETFDIIVTDMAMPGISGASLLNKVKSLYPDMKRIILSGHAERSLEIESSETAHKWLDKPCESQYLIQVLREFGS